MKRWICLFLLIGMLLVPIARSDAEADPIIGDFDADGNVTRSDARALLQAALDEPDSIPLWCDCNLDGARTIEDAACILRYLDGLQPFVIDGSILGQRQVRYTGDVVSALVYFSNPKATVHVAYETSERILPGFYRYRVTLTVGTYRVAGMWEDAVQIVRPKFDISGIDLTAKNVYRDLKNQFADSSIDADSILPAIPKSLSATVWYDGESELPITPGDHIVTLQLTEPSGLFEPIPKLFYRVTVKDLWTDWE